VLVKYIGKTAQHWLRGKRQTLPKHHTTNDNNQLFHYHRLDQAPKALADFTFDLTFAEPIR